MLDPALAGSIKAVAEGGFLLVCAGLVVWMLILAVQWLRSHMSNVEVERQQVVHDARAANEQIAHIAEQLMQQKSGQETVAKRASELVNGGPRATQEEVLLHLLKVSEDIGEIKVRLVQGDATMRDLYRSIAELQERMDHAVNGTAEWSQLAAEIAAIKAFVGIVDASEAAGD